MPLSPRPLSTPAAVLCSAFLAGSLSGCHHSAEPGAPQSQPSEPPTRVSLVTVRETRLTQQLALSGTIRARHVATLATRLSGRISELGVDEGDVVRRGQVLARLDTSAIEAQSAQAQAGVTLAEAGAEQASTGVERARLAIGSARAREQQLRSMLAGAEAASSQASSDQRRASYMFSHDAIPRADLEHATTAAELASSRVHEARAGLAQAAAEVAAAQAGLRQAQAAHEQARAAVTVARAGTGVASSELAYGTVVAPFDGTITRRWAHAGDLASPGRPLLELQDTHDLYLELAAPEPTLRTLLPGHEVAVTIDATGASLQGKVWQLVPAADPRSRSYTVKVRLPRTQGLVAGMYAHVGVPQGSRAAIVVPESTLLRRGQLVEAFVVGDDRRASLRLLTLGAPQGKAGVEVQAGLHSQDRVIDHPPAGLHDGSPVEEAAHGNP